MTVRPGTSRVKDPELRPGPDAGSADDAAAVIGALGLQKPYLLGHSMGAITAATVAANYPDLVRAVVLEDPALQDKPPSQTDINKGLLVTGEEQPAQSGWQWLFDLRALPHEQRIARGFALNPTPTRYATR